MTKTNRKRIIDADGHVAEDSAAIIEHKWQRCLPTSIEKSDKKARVPIQGIESLTDLQIVSILSSRAGPLTLAPANKQSGGETC